MSFMLLKLLSVLCFCVVDCAFATVLITKILLLLQLKQNLALMSSAYFNTLTTPVVCDSKADYWLFLVSSSVRNQVPLFIGIKRTFTSPM